MAKTCHFIEHKHYLLATQLIYASCKLTVVCGNKQLILKLRKFK